MAATFAWAQTYGSAPGTTTSLGVSGNLFNFVTEVLQGVIPIAYPAISVKPLTGNAEGNTEGSHN